MDHIEKFLGFIERRAAKVLRDRILIRSPMTDNERYTLAAFAALMMLRVPGYRNRVKVITKAFLLAHMKAELDDAKLDSDAWTNFLNHFNRLTGHPLPYTSSDQVDITKLIGSLRQSKIVGLQILPLQSIATTIYNMNWTLLRSSDTNYFVLSDYPFNSVGPGAPGGSFSYQRNLTDREVELSIPISRNIALIASWTGHGDRELECCDDIVAQINIRSCSRAEIAVYSPSKTFPGHEQIMKNLGKPFESRFHEDLPKLHELGVDTEKLMTAWGISPQVTVTNATFFCPGSISQEQGEDFWIEQKNGAQKTIGWKIRDARVFRIEVLPGHKQPWVEIGKRLPGSDELVRVIFEAPEGFLICTAVEGLGEGGYIEVGRGSVRRITYFANSK